MLTVSDAPTTRWSCSLISSACSVPITPAALAAQVNYFKQQWQQNIQTPVYSAMFWFALNDNGSNPATMNYGLLNYDKSPRPVYTTMQAATQTDGAL